MPDSVKHQQGFSLPEVLLSIVLMVMVVTALAGGQNHLAKGVMQLNQYRQLWREAWAQTQRSAPPLQEGWSVNRMQTSRQRCVSIAVTIATPAGRQEKMSRLHCPKR